MNAHPTIDGYVQAIVRVALRLDTRADPILRERIGVAHTSSELWDRIHNLSTARRADLWRALREEEQAYADADHAHARGRRDDGD